MQAAGYVLRGELVLDEKIPFLEMLAVPSWRSPDQVVVSDPGSSFPGVFAFEPVDFVDATG